MRFNLKGSILVALLSLVAALTLAHTASAQGPNSASLEQCANGKASAHSDCDWVAGNVNGSKAHYLEGDYLPYRMILSRMSATTHSVVIEWDTLKGGKHAIDFISSFNRTMQDANADPTGGNLNDNNPCLGITALSGFDSLGTPAVCTAANASVPQAAGVSDIPIDLEKVQNAVPNGNPNPMDTNGKFYLWGSGRITKVWYYESLGGSDDPRRIRIDFSVTTANSTLVLAWSGHISTRLSWGALNSAVSITGSPFHTRLVELDGSGGNQDRSLSSDAVVFPAKIKVTKTCDPISPPGSPTFAFTYTPQGGSATDFPAASIACAGSTEKSFNLDADFAKSYIVTEGAPTPDWTLTAIECKNAANATVGTISLANRTISFTLNEGDEISCTYTNRAAFLTLIKQVSGGSAAATEWTLQASAAGGSSISGSTGSSGVTNKPVKPGTYGLAEAGGPGDTCRMVSGVA
jgi:hypothetical protein